MIWSHCVSSCCWVKKSVIPSASLTWHQSCPMPDGMAYIKYQNFVQLCCPLTSSPQSSSLPFGQLQWSITAPPPPPRCSLILCKWNRLLFLPLPPTFLPSGFRTRKMPHFSHSKPTSCSLPHTLALQLPSKHSAISRTSAPFCPKHLLFF